MSQAEIVAVDGWQPIVELGVGDAFDPIGSGLWQQARWGQAGATWNGIEPRWLDVTCETISFETFSGHDRTTDRFEVGTATVVLRNRDGWADILSVASAATLTLRPGRQMRIGGLRRGDPTPRWFWRGYIDQADADYQALADGDEDTVTLSGIDTLGEVGRSMLPVTAVPMETASARIHRILDMADWTPTRRNIEATSVLVQAGEIEGSVVDALTRTADSAGGSITGTVDGKVTFKGRDWQNWDDDDPPDASIGNATPSVPGYWTTAVPAVPGYLTATVGTVSTPDPGPVQGQSVWVARVRGPVGGTTTLHAIASQWPTSGNRSYAVYRQENNGNLAFGASITGVNNVISTAAAPAATGTDEWLALARNWSGGTQALTAYSSTDGVTWTATGTRSIALANVFDSTGAVRIGSTISTADRFVGRIYSVECRSGLNPAAGTLLWRFDASEYPGTGTSFTDPRGRTWTLTSAAAITPMIPAVPSVYVPPVIGDVCPVGWDMTFPRAEITTRSVVANSDGVLRASDDDATGITIYGIETQPERNDLIVQTQAQLDLLAARLLQTRDYETMPRIRAVTFDPSTAPDVLDLVSKVDLTKPGRYKCILRRRGRDVFARIMLATSVTHSCDSREWICRIGLDSALPWANEGDRWQVTGRWQESTWAPDAPALLEVS